MPTTLTTKEVEANKNLLDVRPALKYVEGHKFQYAENLRDRVILARMTMTQEKENRINSVFITGHHALAYRQMLPNQQVKDALSLLPLPLLQMSFLKNVSFERFHDEVVIPGFDKDGFFDPTLVKVVDSRQFSSLSGSGETQIYHPSRILLGQTGRDIIRMMQIPPSVSSDSFAVSAYQFHVFLHEFFHTIEYARRARGLRARLKLITKNGLLLTFNDWWQEYSDLVLSGHEPEPVSFYSQAYKRNLTREVLAASPEQYVQALAEDMAECFAAYVLNICPNPFGKVDFKKRNLREGVTNSRNGSRKWRLMNMLFHSCEVKTQKVL